MRPARRSGALVTLLTASTLVLSGCTLPWTGPDPEPAARRLAAALEKGEVPAPSLTDADDAAQVRRVLAGGPGDPEVSLGEVDREDDAATAELDWTWQVGGKPWRYSTTARLALAGEGDAEEWRVRWSEQLVEPSLREGERLTTSTLRATRGTITGAGDTPIVTPRPVLRVGLDKSVLAGADPVAPARRLARLVGVDAAPLVQQARAAGAKAFVEAIVYRRDDAPADVLAGLAAVPGARALPDELPLAPSKDFASGLLGSVGPATAEAVEKGDGQVQAGDEVGLSGLQQRYDEQLRGTDGAVVSAVGADGERRELVTTDPTAGTPLRTTLDVGVQRTAQQVLSGVGPASALVAIRPSTGDIVAAASGPGSDGQNTATYGRYAPGSTFKVVSTLALLRGGLGADSRVSCPATLVVDGKRFKNYDDYPSSGLGEITLADALANSCNTAFIGQRAKAGRDGLARAAAALGLGVDHDLGFPAYFGQVEPAQSQTQSAAAMIGQGTVLASPMAMATVVASVLRGEAVLPRLLPDVEVQQEQPAEPLTAAEARALRSMMRGVVERGSGSLLQGLPGGEVIAKTGTAEYGDQPPLPTHAWMVAGRGDLAVAVFVETGDSGSSTAGPLLRDFLERVRVP